MNIDYRLIGARIKVKRKRLNYTQEILAEKLDVTVGYISQVERGITRISLDLLAAISDILSCDIAELITDTAVQSSHYLEEEFRTCFEQLSHEDKKLTLDFIGLLLKR